METWQIAVAIAVAFLLAVFALGMRNKPSPRSPGATPGDRPHAMNPQELEAEFTRQAFLPKTSRGIKGRSRLGGQPWLDEDDTVGPTCAVCQQPLDVLLQLDLDHLPDGAPAQRSGGLAQWFACGAGHGERTARVIQPRGDVKLAEGEGDAGVSITGWEEVADLPTFAELEHLHAMLGPTIKDHLASGTYNHVGDKLGGWPAWPGQVDYPPCPDCGNPMEVVFQKTTAGSPPLFLTRCRMHSTRLGFA